MGKATIYLKTALFTVNAENRHLPVGVTVVLGTIEDQGGSGIRVRTERLLDDRGRPLSEARVVLLLPWGKVDHVLFTE